MLISRGIVFVRNCFHSCLFCCDQPHVHNDVHGVPSNLSSSPVVELHVCAGNGIENIRTYISVFHGIVMVPSVLALSFAAK